MIESLVMPAAVPAAMESSKACVRARGEASCRAPVIKAAERTGMGTGLSMLPAKSTLRGGEPMRGESSRRAACGEFRPAIEIRMFGMKFSVVEASAAGNKSVVVVDDRPPMPVESPVVPSPPKAAEEAGSKSETKSDLESVIENAGNRILASPALHRRSVCKPGIVCRQINYFRV